MIHTIVILTFENGTLALRGADKEDARLPDYLSWDARTGCHRAPAVAYAPIVIALRKAGIEYKDEAREYSELPHGMLVHREPRPYQSEALAAWKKAHGRGVVVLPTGAGKTQVATMAIDDKKRSSLVVAPTLELVRQWYDVLRATFGVPVGIVGGGEHTVLPLTVTTYDSAHLHMEHFGAKFGMVVFDEVHHLPSPSYSLAARLCLAPFRLGLTATPERTDGMEAAFHQLVGPMVYRREIGELAGEYLAEYETERVEVELTEEERAEHDAERKIYRDFIGMNHIVMSSPRGFGEFIMRAARSPEGRRAMKAYRRQRELAFAATAKLVWLEHLLDVHRNDRTIIFTQDNATAHLVARRYLVPVITHQTKVTERSEILSAFARGEYTAVATSKVLNEGVDVPDANVAVVLSGSGSVREHVQRLGRILRQRQGKRALLYEVVTKSTTETFTSNRRREHDAYR